ncbi:MAG TPA: hypothetical protein VEU96_23705 [Bryobacteraceae bacterium]|nr:hypothetical protein [Bryobacteraceae bacterium]
MSSSTQSLTPEALRVRHQVRPLQPDEEGFSVTRLPVGVYGFAYAPGQDEVPVFAGHSYHSFEIHKLADGVVFLLGFVTADEARELEAGQSGAAVTLYPAPWEDSQVLVSVPASRIVAPKKLLRREDGNPFHFALA